MTVFFQLIPCYITVILYVLCNQRLIKMRIDKVAFELYSRILHADKEGRLTIDQHRNVGRYRKLRGQVVMWGYNLPPLVHIGLTDLLKPGWAIVYSMPTNLLRPWIICHYISRCRAVTSWGGGGEQLTLFQPGGQILPTTVLRVPLDFFYLATALRWRKILFVTQGCDNMITFKCSVRRSENKRKGKEGIKRMAFVLIIKRQVIRFFEWHPKWDTFLRYQICRSRGYWGWHGRFWQVS